MAPIRWLASTIGKRNYIAEYLRAASPSGSEVIGTGNERHSPGFMSCDRAWIVPAIEDATYLDSVIDICQEEAVTAAITLSDLDVGVLPGLRAHMNEQGIACFFPDMLVAQRFLDKVETASFLATNGFESPATFVDLDEAEAQNGFPLVIKPRKGSASQGFGIFYDRASAEAHWNKIFEPLAQEFVSGRLINVEAISSPDGEVLGLSVWERLSSIAGETLLAETIEHEAAFKTALDLLETSPIPGPIDIDMIDVDGRIVILEVNTRFGGGYPASHLAGAAFPETMVEWVSGAPRGRLRRYRPGIRMMKKLTPITFQYDRLRARGSISS